MNYMRNKLSRGSTTRNQDSDVGAGPHLTISPGQTEETVHSMQFEGEIELSELKFTAEGFGNGVESFLDIAVFEVPPQCTSHNCDLSRFGVGAITHFNSMSYLNLCEAGRLVIDHNRFEGYHTQLMIPSEGPMPVHIKNGKIKVPVKDRSYDILIANCNENGRHIQLTGQVVFDLDDDYITLTAGSLTILTLVAFAVCLFFSLLSVRIERGTHADWEYQQFRRIEALREQRTGQGGENGENADDEESLQEQLRPANVA